ncbi:MAG TPA: gluconate 2-dehydrogenase subunit 3 family protein [Candidatus Bathyarchaeia archaeon]|nr:gluconate 2-dehydrogenase subunit 3 family protein [Candidatus Bathyarchaeia archaeon]
MADQTRREFLKLGMAAAGSAIVASAIEIPLFSNQTNSLKTQLSTANTQITGLQTLVNTTTGFISLSVTEQSLLEAIVETIIPSDSSGPGAKEAGVIHFIDRQLAADYGQSANMFMDAPFVQPGQTGTIVVNGITYTGGTPNPRIGAGTHYQYPLNMREFWRICLTATQTYAKTAYGGNFETLTATNQLQVLNDLWANKPTTASFSNIIPKDFAYELTFMTWAGFLMDPIHGGNRNMVGWTYTGFNGVNFGNFYGEGLDQRNLMVATTPTRLKPASLAQFQQQTSGGP